MPNKRQPPIPVPFQTETRSKKNLSPGDPTNTIQNSQGPTNQRADTPRRSRIQARLSPVPMAANDDLVRALTAFTQAVNDERVQQQQQHDTLVAALNAQQNENAALRDLLTNRPAPVVRPSTAVVESLPKFAGRIDEDVQRFVDHVDQVATAEHWNDAHRIQSAVRRLQDTALQWHVQSGHAKLTWDDWSTALIANFSRRLSYAEWYSMMEARVQKPKESGMEYALDKYRLCRLAPTPLPEQASISFLINGLAKWEHIAGMMAAAPDTIDEFIQRIRELEQLDLSARPEVTPVLPTRTAPSVNQGTPAPPLAQPPPDLAKTFAQFGDRLINELAGKMERLVVGGGVGRGGNGRGGSQAGAQTGSRPPMECWHCHARGHKARFCPQRQENSNAGR